MESSLDRPTPPVSDGARVREWVEWFGLARLVTSALAVAIVCLGAWWLLRAPRPPTEATLPMATPVASTGPPAGTVVPSVERPLDDVQVVIVHVTGSVERPGVYELPPGSRVADALVEAGGPTDQADPGALNLAAHLPDGARIVVPEVGEELPPDAPLGIDTTDVVDPGRSDDAAPPPVIDVNVASALELEALPGVGPATAAAIVLERERNGPFASVGDLERVPGIGPVRLASISELVTT